MSLSISVHLVDKASGTMLDAVSLPPGDDLAGFEVWRKSLYGSDEAKRLGLTLLPTLRQSDIQVAGDDLKKLKKEAESIAGHAGLFASRIGIEESVIRCRAENIGRACDLALSKGAMVWIC